MTILTSATAHGLACDSGAFMMLGNLSCEVSSLVLGPFKLVSPYSASRNVAAWRCVASMNFEFSETPPSQFCQSCDGSFSGHTFHSPHRQEHFCPEVP